MTKVLSILFLAFLIAACDYRKQISNEQLGRIVDLAKELEKYGLECEVDPARSFVQVLCYPKQGQ